MPRPPTLPHPCDLALLRLAVGAAGERYGWWRTQFTKPVGRRMLGRLFPRTSNRALVESVTLAARREHDARISRGGDLGDGPSRPRSTANRRRFGARPA